MYCSLLSHVAYYQMNKSIGSMIICACFMTMFFINVFWLCGGAGKNLQICFMNETASDNESQASEVERNFTCNSKSSSRSSLFSKNSFNHPYQTRPLSVNITKNDKTNTLSGKLLKLYCMKKL